MLPQSVITCLLFHSWRQTARDRCRICALKWFRYCSVIYRFDRTRSNIIFCVVTLDCSCNTRTSVKWYYRFSLFPALAPARFSLVFLHSRQAMQPNPMLGRLGCTAILPSGQLDGWCLRLWKSKHNCDFNCVIPISFGLLLSNIVHACSNMNSQIWWQRTFQFLLVLLCFARSSNLKFDWNNMDFLHLRNFSLYFNFCSLLSFHLMRTAPMSARLLLCPTVAV